MLTFNVLVLTAMLFGRIKKNAAADKFLDFLQNQGIYLESGLISALNGCISQKMHEILLCLKFEAVVDVI